MTKTTDEATTEDSTSSSTNEAEQNSSTDPEASNSNKEEKELTFDDDILGRKKLCENLTENLFNRYEAEIKKYKDQKLNPDSEFKSHTLSLNGKYGTGKTWFLKMWKDFLENDKRYKDKCQVYYLNLWEDEYYEKPIISFSHAITELIKDDSNKEKILKLFTSIDYIESAKASAANVIKTYAGMEIKTKNQKGVFEDYKNLKHTIKETKQAIQDAIAKNGKPLILMVDELDRVRPPHALEVLEVLKHFFNIEGLIFIFAVNREQIETSIKHQYGNDIDFDGYYGRFFSLEAELPSYLDKYAEIIRKNEYVSTNNESKWLADHIAFLMLKFKYNLREVNEFCNNFNDIFPLSDPTPNKKMKILTPITSMELLTFVLHNKKELIKKELKKDLFYEMKNTSVKDHQRWTKIISDISALFDNKLLSVEERISFEVCIEYLIQILVKSTTKSTKLRIDNDTQKRMHQSFRSVGRGMPNTPSLANADTRNEDFLDVMERSPNIIHEICKAIEEKSKFEKHISYDS